jgi:hypothetical protein
MANRFVTQPSFLYKKVQNCGSIVVMAVALQSALQPIS